MPVCLYHSHLSLNLSDFMRTMSLPISYYSLVVSLNPAASVLPFHSLASIYQP